MSNSTPGGFRRILNHQMTSTIVGSGILALAVAGATRWWEQSAKDREEKAQQAEKERDRQREARNKRRELVTKLVQASESTMAVLRSYRDIDIWLKSREAEKPDAKYFGIPKDKVIDHSMSLFQLYVQQPKLESVLTEIDLHCEDHPKILQQSKGIRQQLNRIENCSDATELAKDCDQFIIDVKTLAADITATLKTEDSMK